VNHSAAIAPQVSKGIAHKVGSPLVDMEEALKECATLPKLFCWARKSPTVVLFAPDNSRDR